jgi:hypothetical protein
MRTGEKQKQEDKRKKTRKKKEERREERKERRWNFRPSSFFLFLSSFFRLRFSAAG